MKTPEDVLRVLRLPFQYESLTQAVVDSENHVILELKVSSFLDEDEDDLQDVLGNMIADAMNSKYFKEVL